MQNITCNVARLPGGDDTRTGTDSRGMAGGVAFVPRIDPLPTTRGVTLGDGEWVVEAVCRVVEAWAHARDLVRFAGEFAAYKVGPSDPAAFRRRWERVAFAAVLEEGLIVGVPDDAGERWAAWAVSEALSFVGEPGAEGEAGAFRWAAWVLRYQLEAMEAEAGKVGAA